MAVVALGKYRNWDNCGDSATTDRCIGKPKAVKKMSRRPTAQLRMDVVKGCAIFVPSRLDRNKGFYAYAIVIEALGQSRNK